MIRRLRDMPLSLRLTALYVAILATVLAVLGFVLYSRVEDFLIRDTRDRLVASAEEAIVRRPPNRNRPTPGPAYDQLVVVARDLTSDDTVARIFSANGDVLAGGQEYANQPNPPVCSAVDLQQTIAGTTSLATIDDGKMHQIVLLTPIALGDGTTGALQVTTSL